MNHGIVIVSHVLIVQHLWLARDLLVAMISHIVPNVSVNYLQNVVHHVPDQ